MQPDTPHQLLQRLSHLERELGAVRRELGEEKRRAPLPAGPFPAVRILVGTDEYAVRSDSVREIVRYVRLTRVPGASRVVEGALNLRGDVALVLNVPRRLGLGEARRDLKTPIVVVEMHARPIGLLVDRVLDIVTLDSARLGSASGSLSDGRYVAAVGSVSDRLVQLLDLDELLSLSEIEALEARLSQAPVLDRGEAGEPTDVDGDWT